MSMLTSPVLQVLIPLAEAGEEGSALAGAIAIGVAAFAFLFALLIATVGFGAGRDHS